MSDAWDDEVHRLAALRALRLLDTPREERFDRITRLTHQVLDAPMALVSLVDLERQWFKSCVGLDQRETPRSVSFCAHALRSDELLEVPDARADPRFADNPMVTGPPHIRFYAGQPISAPSGHRIGTLCVLGGEPRELTPTQRVQLRDLASWVELECSVVQANLGLREAEVVKRDFVALVSHELRTPLTSVHGSLELLASGRFGTPSAQANQLLRIAVRNTDRLVRLANDVLDLSRVQSGQLRLRLTDVDLAEVLDSAVGAVAGTAQRHDVELVTACEPMRLRADSDRLVQVFTNLLANAVKASPRGSPVRLESSCSEHTVEVHVIDEGPGVPEDLRERVFEPFVQADSTHTEQGAGLGLTITRGIVQAHGGHVAVAKGPGSAFTVTLPVAGPRDDRPWW
ncbi:GAF domain-containing sensor histidine kinase [Prauserella cavernicola]|uniref:histidine kinase n=1 Tax=Prauserella cavernicola TaxID=2800127 RepID=A0A934QPZ6_9PSEU|nr:GAF domain-containing sensor histidine kinase [Prauserella cavernicola]MBK1784611.1 GAF domain-containing sensor histidine kinase [Prauserella cavernicola]